MYLSLLLAFAGFAALLILSAKTWTEAIISKLSRSDGCPCHQWEGASKLLPRDKGLSTSLIRAPRDTRPSILLQPVSFKYSTLDVYFMHPFLWCVALGHDFFPSKFILALAFPLRFSYFSWLKMPFSLLSLWIFITVPSDKMKCVGSVPAFSLFLDKEA